MNLKYLLFIVASCASLIYCSSAEAGEFCSNENVSQVIIEVGTGTVHFTTDRTCINWCQISSSNQASADRSYSILLTALTSRRPATFYWGHHTAACQPNEAGASPLLIIISQ